jgi:pyridoxal phosphate enzyme (YggS family)
MPVNNQKYQSIKEELAAKGITLVAVSKTKPVSDIIALYELGQRDFGENYVQELTEKAGQLPNDIRWHFIGHLQSNKVKYIAPYVQLIHGVDSLKLLKEINKQGDKNGRVIECLLQVYIASEETKFGLDETELAELLEEYSRMNMKFVRVVGLMGMASFTNDSTVVRKEFRYLRSLFDKSQTFFLGSDPIILSMGMSSDYPIAIEEGSTLVRIGSLLFGERTS